MPLPPMTAEQSPVQRIIKFQLTLSPVLVAANTTAEQTFSIPAQYVIGAGATVLVTKPTAQAGLGIVGARRSGASQIGITFSNNTAGGLTPTAAEVYNVVIIDDTGA